MILNASDLAALKSSLEFWEIVEYISAATVLFGVVGEYVAEFTEFATKMEIEKKLAKISTLVLIVGLTVELLGLVKTSQLSGRLIASLEEQSGEANARAAEAIKVAEQERLARVKIEEKLAWRDLNRVQQERIIAKIATFRGQSFDLITYLEDQEAVNLAKKIGSALVVSQWVHTPSNSALGFSLLLGVVIHVAPSQKANFESAAEALASALQAEGIAAQVKMEAWQDEAAHAHLTKLIQIRVGKKP
jgi:hypothetical protein